MSSFFDNYKDLGAGGRYLKAEDKQWLIENGVTFTINGVQHDPDNEYGPRYVLFVTLPNQETGEEEEAKMGLAADGGVPTRDAMLKAMSEYLNGPDAQPVRVKMSKPGRAQLLHPADD